MKHLENCGKALHVKYPYVYVCGCMYACVCVWMYVCVNVCLFTVSCFLEGYDFAGLEDEEDDDPDALQDPLFELDVQVSNSWGIFSFFLPPSLLQSFVKGSKFLSVIMLLIGIGQGKHSVEVNSRMEHEG